MTRLLLALLHCSKQRVDMIGEGRGVHSGQAAVKGAGCGDRQSHGYVTRYQLHSPSLPEPIHKIHHRHPSIELPLRPWSSHPLHAHKKSCSLCKGGVDTLQSAVVRHIDDPAARLTHESRLQGGSVGVSAQQDAGDGRAITGEEASRSLEASILVVPGIAVAK